MQSVASRRLIIRAEALPCVLCFQLFMFYPKSHSVFLVLTNGCIFLLESEFFNIKISVPCGYGETNILRSLKTQKLQVKYKKTSSSLDLFICFYCLFIVFEYFRVSIYCPLQCTQILLVCIHKIVLNQ